MPELPEMGEVRRVLSEVVDIFADEVYPTLNPIDKMVFPTAVSRIKASIYKPNNEEVLMRIVYRLVDAAKRDAWFRNLLVKEFVEKKRERRPYPECPEGCVYDCTTCKKSKIRKE